MLPRPGAGLEADYYWTQSALHVLEQSLEILSETIKSWEDFNSSGGDIAYFKSLPPETKQGGECLANSLFWDLCETFRQLNGIKGQLLRLLKKCRQRANAVSPRFPFPYRSFFVVALCNGDSNDD